MMRRWLALGTPSWPFIRFCANCGLVLGFKLLCTWLLIQVMNGLVAYLLVHLATFMYSYLMHARYSFGVDYGWENLRGYFRATILFKILDYLIFTVAFAYFGINALWSVLLATVILLLVRFQVVRKTFLPSHPRVPSPGKAVETEAGSKRCR